MMRKLFITKKFTIKLKFLIYFYVKYRFKAAVKISIESIKI